MSDSLSIPLDRSYPPPVLLPDDLATLLDLPSARAAREFISRHGVPHVRLGGRIYVRFDALLAFLEAREETQPTEAEVRERAAGELSRIAPTLQRQQARKQAGRRRGGRT